MSNELPADQYWQHKTTGEVYAVRTNEIGEVTGACGPLSHAEYDFPENLPHYEYYDAPDLVDDLNESIGDYRPLETVNA